MSFLVFSAEDVERLLTMPACVDLMAETLAGLDRGEYEMPLRTVFSPEGAKGRMSWMPSYRRGASPLFGTKLLCVMPENGKLGLEPHQGSVMVMDGETGELRAMMPATVVTAIRTAAVSGVATRLLAREDATQLAIVGTGVQAHRHLASISAVRPISRARVAGRTAERAREFVQRVEGQFGFTIEAVDSAEAAVRGADVIVTATSSDEAWFKREWVSPGAHINAVGASRPTYRELDTATVADAALFTDKRESIAAEASDFQTAVKEGLITHDHVRGELGELLNGKADGRRSREEITLFRSLGLAVEDLAAADFVRHEGERLGIGTLVEA